MNGQIYQRKDRHSELKSNTNYMLPTKNVATLNIKTLMTKSKEMKKDVTYYTNQSETVTTILISAKVDFRAKKITRNKVGHYVMIRMLILQEDITYFNMYMPNSRTTKYMRQRLIELQEEIDEHTVLVGHSNNSLSVNDRPCK